MKALRFVLIMLLSIMLSPLAFADASYPWSNPTYIPTAVSPAASLSAPGSYVVTNNGLSAMVVQISGTCTSLAATVQGTADGTNYVTMPIVPVAGGASVSAVAAPGAWRVNSAGLRKIKVNVSALTASCSFAASGTAPGSFVDQPYVSGDPCANPYILKSSVAINQGASATTAVVAAATGKTTYVCSFAASAVGTNPTLTLKTGTHTTTDCDTGTVSLTGAIIPAAADGMVNLGVGHTVTSGASAGQLCLTTGATTSIEGVMTYVQQ